MFKFNFNQDRDPEEKKTEELPENLEKGYSICIRTVSSQRLFSTLLNQFKLVYGPFGQSNMHIAQYT